MTVPPHSTLTAYHLCICQSVCQCLLTYLPTYLPTYPPTYRPTYLPISLSTNLSTNLTMYLCYIYLSVRECPAPPVVNATLEAELQNPIATPACLCLSPLSLHPSVQSRAAQSGALPVRCVTERSSAVHYSAVQCSANKSSALQCVCAHVPCIYVRVLVCVCACV